jgi:hypothetical protein
MTTQKDFITCANHFQGPELSKLQYQILSRLDQSASIVPAYNRLSQLLQSKCKNTVENNNCNILRDHEGMNNKDIGLGT